VAAIEVRVDGYLITDAVNGQTRSTRLASRHTYNVLGQRVFEIKTYSANGTLRGTLRRTFTLQ
jgi:hypothetical protein